MPCLIVVPDGLKADSHGRAIAEPSFVYQAVLDSVVTAQKKNHELVIYLAPANDFGGNAPEQMVAKHYLERHGVKNIHAPTPNCNGYIDTMGNGIYLKQYMIDLGIDFPPKEAYLLVAQYHAKRAIFCFEHCGFIFEKIYAVPYNDYEKTPIVKRLFYYHYPVVHRMYECLALLRDKIRTL